MEWMEAAWNHLQICFWFLYSEPFKDASFHGSLFVCAFLLETGQKNGQIYCAGIVETEEGCKVSSEVNEEGFKQGSDAVVHPAPV